MTRLKLLAGAALVVFAVVVAVLRYAEDRPQSQPDEPQPTEVAATLPTAPAPAPVTPIAPLPHAPAGAPAPAPAPEADPVPPLARFGDSRLRHRAPVTSVALTHDGAHLLTATRDEPVLHLWNVTTG